MLCCTETWMGIEGKWYQIVWQRCNQMCWTQWRERWHWMKLLPRTEISAVWYPALWQLSWAPPCNLWVTIYAVTGVTGVPVKEAAVHCEYAEWVCSGGWGRAHSQEKEFCAQTVSLSRSVCWGWEQCKAGMCARWYRSPKTALWVQKLNFSLRSTVEAINWPLALFHCFLSAWVFISALDLN